MMQKYRAFHKKKKRMRLVEMIEFDSQRVLTRRERRIGNISHDIWYFKDIILMQSIGKSDKSNNEIFDGDIVLHKNGFRYIVEYNKLNSCWCLVQPRDEKGVIEKEYTGGQRGQDMRLHVSEVIGNVRENPELLVPGGVSEAKE